MRDRARPPARSSASCSARLQADRGGLHHRRSRRRRCAASATPAASRCRCRTAPATASARCSAAPTQIDGPGAADAGPRRRLHHLQRQLAADLPRDRPHQGADAQRADRQHLRDAAGQSRLGLRQRLQRFRPHLPGPRPGRPGLPHRARRHRAPQGAQRHRRAGAARHAGRTSSIAPGPTSSSATTCTPRCRCRATRAPGTSAGQALAAMEQLARETLPPGMSASNGPSSPTRSSSPATPPIFIFALSVAVRLPGARGAVRELVAAAGDHPDRADERAVGAARRAGCAAWTTTS